MFSSHRYEGRSKVTLLESRIKTPERTLTTARFATRHATPTHPSCDRPRCYPVLVKIFATGLFQLGNTDEMDMGELRNSQGHASQEALRFVGFGVANARALTRY